MRRPRLSLRGMLILIAVLAVLLAVAPRLLGPRDGAYSGHYWWIDGRWPFYHEIRGASITVSGGMVLSD